MTKSDRLGQPLAAAGDEVLDIGGLAPHDVEGATVYDRHEGVVDHNAGGGDVQGPIDPSGLGTL